MPEIRQQLTFRPNLCYFPTRENKWLREEDPLGGFTRPERSLQPFFERRGQGRGIISG